MVKHACNPRTWKPEQWGLLWVWGQPKLYSKVLSQTKEPQGSQQGFRYYKNRKENGHFGINFIFFFNQGIQFHFSLELLGWILSITMKNKTHQWITRPLPANGKTKPLYTNHLWYSTFFSQTAKDISWFEWTHQLLLFGKLTYRHLLNKYF